MPRLVVDDPHLRALQLVKVGEGADKAVDGIDGRQPRLAERVQQILPRARDLDELAVDPLRGQNVVVVERVHEPGSVAQQNASRLDLLGQLGGRGGLDPARYGDWEVKGVASDF